MKIEENLTLELVRTTRSKKGREVISMLIGHLGENARGSTVLFFPDPDYPEKPFWWMEEGERKSDSTYGEYTEVETIGTLNYRKWCVIKVELDYEDKPRAQRLKILSANGVAFFSEYEGVVPHWANA